MPCHSPVECGRGRNGGGSRNYSPYIPSTPTPVLSGVTGRHESNGVLCAGTVQKSTSSLTLMCIINWTKLLNHIDVKNGFKVRSYANGLRKEMRQNGNPLPNLGCNSLRHLV